MNAVSAKLDTKTLAGLVAQVAGGKDAYTWMMDAPSYTEFSQRNWRLHDNIHVWVGGTKEKSEHSTA